MTCKDHHSAKKTCTKKHAQALERRHHSKKKHDFHEPSLRKEPKNIGIGTKTSLQKETPKKMSRASSPETRDITHDLHEPSLRTEPKNRNKHWREDITPKRNAQKK